MVKKRGNGQGYARKRGNTWTAVWMVGFEVLDSGKLRQAYKTKGGFRTKTEALQYASNPNGDSNGKAPNPVSYTHLLTDVHAVFPETVGFHGLLIFTREERKGCANRQPQLLFIHRLQQSRCQVG